MDNHKLVMISNFFFNMRKIQFLFFMRNMLAKILGFGRMQQNIYFFLFEKVLNFFYYFFEIFQRKLSILIPDLYFTV